MFGAPGHAQYFFFSYAQCALKNLHRSVKAEMANIYIPISFSGSFLFAAPVLEDTGDEGCTT